MWQELSLESIPSQNDLESLSDCGSLARKEVITGKKSEKVATTLSSLLYVTAIEEMGAY